MNIANYSPYNKSYRFLCFQNKAYHEKNKKNMSPTVKTNLKYFMNSTSTNPESFIERRFGSSPRKSRPSSRSQLKSSWQDSQSMLRSSSLSNAVVISSSPRVIHKNESFQKFRSKKITNENIELVGRLLQTQCQVIRQQETEKSFRNHLRYREIRKVYNDQGERKSKVCLGNTSLLCPTLSVYSKNAQKFADADLSMSMAPSTASSRLRRRRSGQESRVEMQADQ